MDNLTTNIELLYEKAKDYAEINVELIKMHAIDKTADVVSSIMSRLVLLVSFTMFLLFVNISLSLYLGELLGETYWGFLIVSGVYLLITIIVSASRNKFIKVPITNLVIAKLLQTKSKSNNTNTNTDGVI